MSSKLIFSSKHEDLFRMGGAALRAEAAGNPRLARTKAAKQEIARRKANAAAAKASK